MSQMAGEWQGDTFNMPKRIYFQDTDAMGAVYHARYLDFCEQIRTEMIYSIGVDHVGFVTHTATNLSWKAPAEMGKTAMVTGRVKEIKGIRITLEHQVIVDEKVCFEMEITLVCISDETGRPTKIPAEIVDFVAQQQAA